MKKLQPFSSRRIPLGLLCCSLLMAFWLAACATRPAQPATTPAPDAASTDASATNGSDGADTEETTDATDAVTTTEDAASAASNASTSPLASPLAQPTPTATPIPRFETEEGTGVVTGYLLVQTEAGIEPVTDVTVALASVLKNAEGEEAVVGYDRIGAPRDVTDENGFFAITDVPPDRYGLIMDTVMTSYLLAMPDGSGDMLITVEGDDQIDMGELSYEMLPLPEPVE